MVGPANLIWEQVFKEDLCIKGLKESLLRAMQILQLHDQTNPCYHGLLIDFKTMMMMMMIINKFRPFVRIPCSIIPHPSISIHSPSYLTSNSHEGCVKGKYASTHLVSASSPNKSSTSLTRVYFKLNSTSFAASREWTSCFSALRLPVLSNIFSSS